MDDNDSDVEDLLNDLLASNEEPGPEPSKPETALKELGLNFLETASNSNETSSPKKSTNSVHDENLDSSDDEDKRYFKRQTYSDAGRDIKNILKKVESEKKDQLITREVLRESKHTFDFNKAKGNLSQSSNLYKSNKSQLNTNSSPASTNSTSIDVYSDPIFGLRITKPLISSAELKDRMLGRTPVTVSKVKNHVTTANLQDDWVIAGVVINKSPVLKSQKGSQYCIWKISDLSFDMNVVSLFLFSGAYKALWKTATGAVIGILNPNVLESKDDKDQATLSVDNAQKVMILGTSRDMGTCKSTTKAGKPCTAIVNRSRCEFCVFHVQKEYKQCSRRADIQSSANGRGFGPPSAHGKNFGPKKVQPAITQSHAQNFVGVPARRNQKQYQKDLERLALLTGSKKAEKKEGKKLEIEKQDSEGEIKNLEEDKKCPVPQNGAKNEVKRHMVELTSNQMKKDFERLNKLKGLARKAEKEAEAFEELLTKSAEKEPSEPPVSTKKEGFTLSKLQALNANESTSLLSKTPGFTRSKLQEWTMKQGFGISPPSDSSPKSLNLNSLSKSSNCKTSKSPSRSNSLAKSFSSFSNSLTESPDSPLNSTLPIPRLGNGITSGSIDFSEPISKKQVNYAKLSALKWVRENGGIKRSNPNKILLSKEKKEQGLKRKREPENEDKKLKEGKKLPDKFKELMEATSAHVNLIEQSEEEEKEKYFGKLELKEKMEEKMMTTFKVPCKAVICSICKYTAFSSSDMCKEMSHPVKVIDAVKRFFKCGDCGNRTVSLDKIPTLSCKKCNSSNWKRAAMMDEKKADIPGATLSLRGGEEKFIGSFINNANLNLLVPE